MALHEDVEEQDLHRMHPVCLPGKTAQFVGAVVVNLLSLSFGAVVGWSAVAGPQLNAALGFTEETVSWGAALPALTTVLGAFVYGQLTESRGRRPTALLAGATLVAGWALLGWAPDSPVAMLVSRGVLGFANGGVLVVCPIYTGEIVEDSLRGTLGSLVPFAINSGVLFVFAFGALVSLPMLSVVCGAVPMALLLAFPWLPETPVFLLRRGDESGALRALTWLRDPRCSDVRAELAALKASMKEEEEEEDDDEYHHATPRDLVGSRGSRRALIIVVGLAVLQQLVGIGAVLGYAVHIFKEAGSSLPASGAVCVVAATQVLGSVLACVLVDRLGRVPLLYASFTGMTVSLALLGASFYWQATFPAWLPVLSLSAYILLFALGPGCMPFLLLVEVFPPSLRHLAGQVALVALSLLAFAVTKYFKLLSHALANHGVFWLFAAFCAAGVAFTRVFVLETKGKPVDHIIAELEGFRPSQHHSDHGAEESQTVKSK